MNPNYDFEKLRFLVVDDNKYMRTLVKAILHSFRIKTVDEAEDAIMAFKLLKSFPIDVVITDFNMPILDGIEFVKMV